MIKMKILCLCDSLTLTSGFARVASNLLRRWAAKGATIDCWGIAFQGWGYKKHPYINTFFPAGTGRAEDHWASAQRLEIFLAQLKTGEYTHVWIMQDTFQLVNFDFPVAFRQICAEQGIRSMYYFPVDAELDPEWSDIIAAVDVPVAYTEYGKAKAGQALAARKAQLAAGRNEPRDIGRTGEGLNYDVSVRVLPHGVDTTIYHPIADRMEVRKRFWNKEFAGPDDFLMVNVNVNQRRKDVARSLELLKAVRNLGVPAKLAMHMSPVSDDGLNLELVGRQLGLRHNQDWCHHGHLFVQGQSRLSEDGLVQLYNVADLYLTTSLGEGWGLGITEALACGTPVAVPAHTSCGEIASAISDHGLTDMVVPLPTEKGDLVQGLDNSRCRPRVSLDEAALALRAYYDSGVWKKRFGLTQPVREWLAWDRIAREMLQWMKEATGPAAPFGTKPDAPTAL